MSRLITRSMQLGQQEPWHDKTNKISVRPAKTQISLGIRPVWSESSLCTQRVDKDPSFLRADSEDSDQTGRMPRLIRIFAWRVVILFVLSCRGSYHIFVTIIEAGDNLHFAYVIMCFPSFAYRPARADNRNSCNLNREKLSCPGVAFARHVSVTSVEWYCVTLRALHGRISLFWYEKW